MPPLKTLSTWAERSTFRYSGSIQDGITINYGRGFKYKINIRKEYLKSLLLYFQNQITEVGTSRTNPPINSVGRWLMENVSPTAISSYVCPILIEEGYAEQVGRSEIRFNKL